VNGALLFLLARSVRGRILRMARRLREPKYLFGFLIGAGWTLFWVSRIFFSRVGGGDIQFGVPDQVIAELAGPLGQAIQLAGALGVAIAFAVWWAIPFGRNSLEYSEAELHLLLPAPVSRRSLIQYGILRSQPPIMLGAAIVTFFSGGGNPAGLAARFLGLWLFFSAWDLHGKARGLWLARLGELPAKAAWRKRILLWLVLLVAVVVLVAGVGSIVLDALAGPLPQDSDGAPEWLREVGAAYVASAWDGLLGWMLTPFIWLIAPFFLGFAETSLLDVAVAWSFPLLVLLVHNEWVVRSQTRFEEAALDHARRSSKKLDPAAKFWKRSQRSRSWHPFALPATGLPELAIVWKNLMIASRFPLVWMIALGAGAIALLAILVATSLLPAWLAVVLQAIGGLMVVVAPLLSARSLRHDLRTDLLKVELIRPWPIEGWRMFLAQIATPVLLAMLQCLAGATLYITIDLLIVSGLLDINGGTTAFIAEVTHLPPAIAAAVVFASVLPLSLMLAALATSVENLAALTFPSWVQLGLQKAQAASRVGQNLLVFFVLSLVITIGMAPGVLLIAGILAVQILFWGIPLAGWELPVLGILGAAPIGAVVAALVRAGGSLWDRLDPSEEILSGQS